MVRNVTWAVNGIYKADPQKVYGEIESIASVKSEGDVTPQEIVAYAEKHKKSELYKCFDWDDKSAAQKYRVIQAREIVRHLVVTIPKDETDEKSESIAYRVIQHSPETKAYKPVVLMNETEYAKALREAWDYFKKGKAKYGYLQDSGLQAVMDLI